MSALDTAAGRSASKSTPETKSASASNPVPTQALPPAGVRAPRDRRPSMAARVRRLGEEVVKFGLVGGSGVGVNFLVFNLLLHGVGAGPMPSTVLASSVAICTNYLGFRFFAYRDRAARGKRQLVLFFVFSGLGVVAESALFSLAYHGIGMAGPIGAVGANVAKALSIVLASAFRFLVYRTWVFQRDAHRG